MNKFATTLLAVSLTFGDGVTGSRLPTGSANVTASYRIGTGLAGLLRDGRAPETPAARLAMTEAIFCA